MKVLLVNTFDKGGAANSCLRLHEGLFAMGVDSSVLLKHQDRNITATYRFRCALETSTTTQKFKNKFRRVLKEFKLIKKKPISNEDLFCKNRLKKLEMFSFPNSQIDITTSQLYDHANIINLHWVANFLDYSSFFLKNTKPVVWTLHDMNPFSGGEHYLEEYLGIDELGFPIKRILTREELEMANRNISVKLEAILKTQNLTIVAPSKWLMEEAKKSLVFEGLNVHHIPYGLNSEIFAPRNKDFSREILNIPKDKKVILFVADSINNSRKGFAFLKKAFEELSNEDVILCAIGLNNGELKTIKNVIELGVITDERLMSMAYSAADVFILPSLIDNLPNTVLESIMCGTPVIAFPVGGIPDMIENNINGFITEEISVNSLLKSINQFLNTPNFFDRSKIRVNAVAKYSLEIQAQKYVELFDSISK